MGPDHGFELEGAGAAEELRIVLVARLPVRDHCLVFRFAVRCVRQVDDDCPPTRLQHAHGLNEEHVNIRFAQHLERIGIKKAIDACVR